MIKICFVIPTLLQGGMERVLVELANFSAKAGYNITIICLFKSEIKYSLEKNIEVIFPDFLYQKSFFMKARVVYYLYKAVKKVSPDVLLGFGEIFNSMAILVCKITRTKVFISERSSPIATQGKTNDILKKILYPFASGIVAQTDFARDVFLRKGFNKNIITIPNPLRCIVNEEVCQKKESKVIVTVGRATRSKNHCELIQIFKEINRLDWKLYIVGDGPMMPELLTLVSTLELENNVFLVGSTDNVDTWLQKADIFAYTSLTEGFPNALSEAVAFPLPCIAYNCIAGPSDIIRHGWNGLLIPVGDKAFFLEQLRLLMNDTGKRNSLIRNAYLNRELFSIQKIGNRYIDFLFKSGF